MYDLTARKTVDEVSVAGGVRYVAGFSETRDNLVDGPALSPIESCRLLDRGLVAEWSLRGVYVQAQCLDPEAGSGG